MSGEQFFTVPWAPGMEERQMVGEVWAVLEEKKRLLAIANPDRELFRWQVIMNNASAAADGKGMHPAAMLMLALGMLDVQPCGKLCCIGKDAS